MYDNTSAILNAIKVLQKRLDNTPELPLKPRTDFQGWIHRINMTLRDRYDPIRSPNEVEHQLRTCLTQLNALTLHYLQYSLLSDIDAHLPAIQSQAVSAFAGTPKLIFVEQLAGLKDDTFDVRIIEPPETQAHATSRLPFSNFDMTAIHKLFEWDGYDPQHFRDDQTQRLRELGLLIDDRLVSDFLIQIGRKLYEALFPGELHTLFQSILRQAKRIDAILLQLRFDEDAVELSRYPWELIHDGQYHLVGIGKVHLTRYITYQQHVSETKVKPPWKILYIAPRPIDMDWLGQDEQTAVWQSLQKSSEQGIVESELLVCPTYKAFVQQIRQQHYDVIHVDSHGIFGRRCPRCKKLNYPHLTVCANCQGNIQDVSPTAFLAFEDGGKQTDFVSAWDFTSPMAVGNQITLAFISACQSATVRGATVFSGLAPALIRAGIPAAVGMQYSFRVDATKTFVTEFYNRLSTSQSISGAFAEARLQLLRDGSWFIPALYLRSSNPQGEFLIP